ncbi:MAG: cytochrome c [Acidimicrobiia bacterium]|nr:MAG: cytochrome c [Acidimicrobiia bacterium]
MHRSSVVRYLCSLMCVLVLAGCAGDTSSSSTSTSTLPPLANVQNGEAVFLSTCTSCHGEDARGIEGLGKPLAGSDFVAQSSESALVRLITFGRPASDPTNSTGIAMPARGGNPSLTEQSIRDVVAYLKSLN